jgi:hypothetical protein
VENNSSIFNHLITEHSYKFRINSHKNNYRNDSGAKK